MAQRVASATCRFDAEEVNDIKRLLAKAGELYTGELTAKINPSLDRFEASVEPTCARRSRASAGSNGNDELYDVRVFNYS